MAKATLEEKGHNDTVMVPECRVGGVDGRDWVCGAVIEFTIDSRGFRGAFIFVSRSGGSLVP